MGTTEGACLLMASSCSFRGLLITGNGLCSAFKGLLSNILMAIYCSQKTRFVSIKFLQGLSLCPSMETEVSSSQILKVNPKKPHKKNLCTGMSSLQLNLSIWHINSWFCREQNNVSWGKMSSVWGNVNCGESGLWEFQ